MRRCSTLSASSIDDSDCDERGSSAGSTRASLDSLISHTAPQVAQLQHRCVAVSDVPRWRSTLIASGKASPNSKQNTLPPKPPGSLSTMLLHRSSGSGRRGSCDSAASYDTFDNCSSDDGVEVPRGSKHRESLDSLLLNTQEQIADLKQRGVAAVDHPKRRSTLAGGRVSLECKAQHLPPKPPASAKRATAAAASRCEQLRRSSFDSATSNEVFGDASSDDCDKIERRGGRHRESLDSLIASTAEQIADLRERTVAVSDAPRRRSALVGTSRLSRSEPPARLTNRRDEQSDRAIADASKQQQFTTAQAVSQRCEQLRSSSGMRRISTDSSASHEVHSEDSDFDYVASARGRESLDSLLVNTAAQIADLTHEAVVVCELPRRRSALSSSEHSLEAVPEPLSSEHNNDAVVLVHTEQPALSNAAHSSSDTSNTVQSNSNSSNSNSSSSSSGKEPDLSAALQPVSSESGVLTTDECTKLQAADITAYVTAQSAEANDAHIDAVEQLQQPAVVTADSSTPPSTPSSSGVWLAVSTPESSANSDAAPLVQTQQSAYTSPDAAKLEQPQPDDSSTSTSSSSSSSEGVTSSNTEGDSCSSSVHAVKAVCSSSSATQQLDATAQLDGATSMQHDRHCEALTVAAAHISSDAASVHSTLLLSSTDNGSTSSSTSSSSSSSEGVRSSSTERGSGSSSVCAVEAVRCSSDATEHLDVAAHAAAQYSSAAGVQHDQHCEAETVAAARVSSDTAFVHSTQLLSSTGSECAAKQHAVEPPQAALVLAERINSIDGREYNSTSRASVAPQLMIRADAVQQQQASLDDNSGTVQQQDERSEKKIAAIEMQPQSGGQMKQAAAVAAQAVEPAVYTSISAATVPAAAAAVAATKRLQLLWQHPSDIGLGVSMYPALDRATLKQLQREWAAEVYKV
jgi:hypothetical protein